MKTMQQAVDEAGRKARRDSEHWMRQCHRHAERAAVDAEKREAGK